jgi:predicted Fe-Mo cluster-binding NifX family protein
LKYQPLKSNKKMKIAIPTNRDQLSQHFGKCDRFTIFEVDENQIVREHNLIPPRHQPGVLPVFLASNGVGMIFACGMGQSAIDHFAKSKIKVITGVQPDSPRVLVEAFLQNRLETGFNLCDH